MLESISDRLLAAWSQETLTLSQTLSYNSYPVSIVDADEAVLWQQAVEVWAWMSNYISLFYMDVITYPCPNLNAGLGSNRSRICNINHPKYVSLSIFQCFRYVSWFF